MIFHLFCVPVASPEPPEGINKQYELFTFSKVYFWSVLNRTFLAHLISQGRSHDTSSIVCVPVASPDPPEGINRQCELFTFSKVYFWSVPNRTFLAHQISQGRSHNFSFILCSSCPPPDPPTPEGINIQCELCTFSKVQFCSVSNRTFQAHLISQGRSHNFSSMLCSSWFPNPPRE